MSAFCKNPPSNQRDENSVCSTLVYKMVGRAESVEVEMERSGFWPSAFVCKYKMSKNEEMSLSSWQVGHLVSEQKHSR